jgi:hypothetical protein
VLNLNIEAQDICRTNGNEAGIDNLVKGTVLERWMISDSIDFELRFWICTYFLPDKMIQITNNAKSQWNYNLGFFRYEKKKKIFEFQDSIKQNVDWVEFKSKLDSFLKADLPDQYKIDLTYETDGAIKRVNAQDFFSGINDGVLYTVEIFNNNDHVTITYHVPEVQLIRLKKTALPVKEHEIFVNFINYLKDFWIQ